MQLFYVSRATSPYDEAAVQGILTASRRNNPRRDVTGCLLFSGRYYAQVIEGRPEVIAEMAQMLRHDRRHAGFRIVSEQISTQRAYEAWSMGYMHSLDLEDDLERIVEEPEIDAGLVRSTIQRIRPDPLTGQV